MIIRRSENVWRCCDGLDHAQYLLEGLESLEPADVISLHGDEWWKWDPGRKTLHAQPMRFGS